jgi:hypothetical protein
MKGNSSPAELEESPPLKYLVAVLLGMAIVWLWPRLPEGLQMIPVGKKRRKSE